jgi:hypothetical protein
MAKNTGEGINFKIVMPTGAAEGRKPSPLFRMTLEKVHQWLDRKKLDPRLTLQLKKMASVYPEQALENWVKNFRHHLTNARNALKLNVPETTRVELGDEPPVHEVNSTDTSLNEAPVNDEFS